MTNFRKFDDRLSTSISKSLHSRSVSVDSHLHLQHHQPKSPIAENFIKWSETETITRIINSPHFIHDHGSVTCIEVSPVYIAVGTTAGYIAVFNFHQSIEFVLKQAPGAESSISSIAFSADSSSLAAGGVSGNITLWQLVEQHGQIAPLFTIFPVTPEARALQSVDGHTINSPITSLSFIGDLESRLISSDTSEVYLHVGFRKFLQNHFVTQKLMGSENSTINCKLLSLGSSLQLTDQTGLLAVISGNIIAVVSILSLDNPNSVNPVTHFKLGKPKGVNSSFPMTCLSWYPCMERNGAVINARLAYSWNNVLTILEVQNDKLLPKLVSVFSELREKDKALPKFPMAKTARWRCPEENDKIVSIHWMAHDKVFVGVENEGSVSIHALYYSKSLSLVGTDDIGHNSLITLSVLGYQYLASIKLLKKRMVLLAEDSVSSYKKIFTGSSLTWADTLMQYITAEDYSAALTAANDLYLSTNTGQLVLAELPSSPEQRCTVLKPYLVKIVKESVSSLFQEDNFNHEYYLGIYLDIISYLSKDTNTDLTDVLQQIFECFENKGVFFELLESYVLSRNITSLPPLLLKELVKYYTSHGKGHLLSEIICILDTKTLDIDLTLRLCQEYGLKECSVYIWNYILHDYETPLLDFIEDFKDKNVPPEIFPYITYILTGRQYPSDRFIDVSDEAFARESICKVLFSVTGKSDGIFPNLTLLLQCDSFETLKALNEFFENPCLNDNSLNRQYIVDAILDVFDSYEFPEFDHVQLSIFLARNYPKYTQFIILPVSMINRIADTLLASHYPDIHGDCELALQSILPYYEPDDEKMFLEKLKAAHFYDVLINRYRSENRHDKVLHTWLEKQNYRAKDRLELYNILENALNQSKTTLEKTGLVRVLEQHFESLVQLDASTVAKFLQKLNPASHLEVLKVDESLQLKYLRELFSMNVSIPSVLLITKYCELLSLSQQQGELLVFVKKYVSKLAEDVEEIEKTRTILQKNKAVDSLTELLVHGHHFEDAMKELTQAMKQQVDELEDIDTFKEKFDRYFECAVGICHNPGTFKNGTNEHLWLLLIENLVVMANNASNLEDASQHINKCIHKSFRIVVDTKSNDQEKSFSTIFSKFLQHSSANSQVATLSNVRGILQEVLVSYSYDSEMLKMSVNMLNQGIYKDMRHIKLDKLQGWDIQNKLCTSCGKTMWGPDVSLQHYQAWQARASDMLVLNTVKVNDMFAVPFDKERFFLCELKFFKCTHGYHLQCLVNLGSINECVLCESETV